MLPENKRAMGTLGDSEPSKKRLTKQRQEATSYDEHEKGTLGDSEPRKKRLTKQRQEATSYDEHEKAKMKEVNNTPLKYITPTTEQWTTKVGVRAKSKPIVGKKGVRFQKLLLVDEAGDTVDVIIFGNDIDSFVDSLEVGETYSVSNATVTPANQIYKNPLATSNYQWKLTERTVVLLSSDEGIKFPPVNPTFYHRAQFPSRMTRGTLISTVCVIIDKRPPRTVKQNTLREYAAVDKNLQPFVVTFWDDIISHDTLRNLDSTHQRPVFALLNFIVTDYYGISLSSTSQSLVYHTLNHDEFLAMKRWRNSNAKAISSLISQGGLFEEKLTLECPDMVSVHEVANACEDSKFNLLVKGRLMKTSQKFHYMSCEQCPWSTTAEFNSDFICRNCKKTSTAKPRYRFVLNIYDDTDDLDVVLFGDEAEKILGISMSDYYTMYTEGQGLQFEDINGRLQSLWLRMRVKRSTNQTQQEFQNVTYNVNGLQCYRGEPGRQLMPCSDIDLLDSSFGLVGRDGDAMEKRRLIKAGKQVSFTEDTYENQLGSKTENISMLHMGKHLNWSDESDSEAERNRIHKKENHVELTDTDDDSEISGSATPVSDVDIYGNTIDEPDEATLAELFMKPREGTRKHVLSVQPAHNLDKSTWTNTQPSTKRVSRWSKQLISDDEHETDGNSKPNQTDEAGYDQLYNDKGLATTATRRVAIKQKSTSMQNEELGDGEDREDLNGSEINDATISKKKKNNIPVKKASTKSITISIQDTMLQNNEHGKGSNRKDIDDANDTMNINTVFAGERANAELLSRKETNIGTITNSTANKDAHATISEKKKGRKRKIDTAKKKNGDSARNRTSNKSIKPGTYHNAQKKGLNC